MTVDTADVDLASLERLKDAHHKVREQIARVVVGQDEVIEQLLISIFARGHCILEGVPGLAKTLMVSTLAQCLSLDFSRIQFTPDLMPSDITGTDVLQEDRSTGTRELQFVRGPVFAQVLLADEINRTPPKTQAALLEAMQERQVSAGGKRHKLPDPFFVLATQNPIEQEGTYPLPEAQLDRFLFKVFVGYPSPDEGGRIYRLTTGIDTGHVEVVLSVDDILHVQSLVRRVPISDYCLDYAMSLVRATRPGESHAPAYIGKWLAWGAGPRAGQALILAAKARAAMEGRTSVTVDDLKAVAPPVLRHRLLTNYAAQADGQSPDSIITRLLADIPVHATTEPVDGHVAQVLRAYVLAKIVGLGWRARRVVEGTISGQHKSPFHGFSVEFAEYREYSPGDDLRRLDWRVFGRTDRHYVKLYEEESNLRCTLVMDCSASMRYKSDKAALSKFDYGATLAASLATLLVGQQDPVGLALFDKSERRLIPSAATQAKLVEIIDALEAAKPDNETDLGTVLQTLAGKLKKRGLIIIISDLLTDEESLLDGLSRLQYRGHEVVIFQVLDRDELEMPFQDMVQFKDIEGAEELFAEPWAFRQAYRAAMNDFLAGVRSVCSSHGVDHQLLLTDQDLGDALSFYLHVRGRIHAAHHATHKPHRPR